MTAYVFVTGGVISSVGKGITVASIGRILESRDISVSVLKLAIYFFEVLIVSYYLYNNPGKNRPESSTRQDVRLHTVMLYFGSVYQVATRVTMSPRP